MKNGINWGLLLRNKWTWIALVVALIIVILVSPVHKSPSEMAYDMAREFVSEQLGEPEDIVFSEYNEDDVEHVEEDSVYLVQGTVSYPNGLGVVEHHTFMIALRTEDNNTWYQKYIEIR